MVQDGSGGVILYEYPFNERVRTHLRLEQLFRRLGELISRDSAVDHHFALVTIFEIMEVASRSDLKGEVLKELEKQKQVLNSYRGNPHISEGVLDDIVAQLDACFEAVNHQAGRTAQSLTENEWLMAIRSRISIPGGTCSFDLPAYHAWQQKSGPLRQLDLQKWAATLGPLADSVTILLKMLRDNGTPKKMMAEQGQLQQNLPQGRAFQLLRLRVDSQLGLIPEISANRLLVSLRFLKQEADPGGPATQVTADDVAFEMALCA
jgi:cell division protein ZapD